MNYWTVDISKQTLSLVHHSNVANVPKLHLEVRWAGHCTTGQMMKMCHPSAFAIQYRFALVLWRCWLGSTKGIQPVKNSVVRCWHGYLSGTRCRLAYGPADATATHCFLCVSLRPLNGCMCVCTGLRNIPEVHSNFVLLRVKRAHQLFYSLFIGSTTTAVNKWTHTQLLSCNIYCTCYVGIICNTHNFRKKIHCSLVFNSDSMLHTK